MLYKSAANVKPYSRLCDVRFRIMKGRGIKKRKTRTDYINNIMLTTHVEEDSSRISTIRPAKFR